MALSTTRRMRRQLEADNRHWPDALKCVPEHLLAMTRLNSEVPRNQQPVEVWRSTDYLVQVFQEADGCERLSIQTTHSIGKRFADGLSWDVLQHLKSECGRGDKDAVEIYPRDSDVVNVANIRHLWVLPLPFPYTWRKA